ncbi:MAG TPA: hypothetical protein VFO49_17090 [Nocardioides sp.]|jgi:hypothetical protein|nr:hypothetical protein [Nocardioides sp.]
MNTPTKVAVFVVGLAVVFVGALGIGNAVGPVADEPVSHDDEHVAGGSEDEHGGGHGDTAETAPAADIPGGLMISQDGYTFRLSEEKAQPGKQVLVAFTIEGPDGQPVTAYDVEHEKQLHLIATRRDFTGFQHVHPVLDADGTWRARLDLTPGAWRLFADFKATGAEALTLGADLSVAGDYEPEPPSSEVRTAQVDGYTVTLEGDLTAGADARLTLSVSKDGRPVTDLEPYLGAYGHLVALREGDLAYLHVHPDGSPGDGETEPGPDVVFYAAVPSDGGYRLYLDFQHDGVVRTAAFAVSAGEVPSAQPEETPADTPHEEEEGDHGH